MSNRDELLARIRNRPNSVRFEELTKLLEWYGFELRRVKGSHYAYRRGSDLIIIAYHKPHVQSYIVKQVLKAVGELSEEEQGDC